jgi:hypothetical protein
MTAPKRIQLSRKRGWRMPENAVKVDRSTKWGNPFVIGEDGTQAKCVSLFHELLTNGGLPPSRSFAWTLRASDTRARILEQLDQLRGKNLACWCPLDQPCHADVLLQLANAPIVEKEG